MTSATENKPANPVKRLMTDKDWDALYNFDDYPIDVSDNAAADLGAHALNNIAKNITQDEDHPINSGLAKHIPFGDTPFDKVREHYYKNPYEGTPESVLQQVQTLLRHVGRGLQPNFIAALRNLRMVKPSAVPFLAHTPVVALPDDTYWEIPLSGSPEDMNSSPIYSEPVTRMLIDAVCGRIKAYFPKETEEDSENFIIVAHNISRGYFSRRLNKIVFETPGGWHIVKDAHDLLGQNIKGQLLEEGSAVLDNISLLASHSADQVRPGIRFANCVAFTHQNRDTYLSFAPKDLKYDYYNEDPLPWTVGAARQGLRDAGMLTADAASAQNLVWSVTIPMFQPYQRLATLWAGDGGNGKSTIIDGIKDFAGHLNEKPVSVPDLAKGGFDRANAAYSLVGSQYYVDSDVSGDLGPNELSSLNPYTTGDEVPVRAIGANYSYVAPRGTLIIASNFVSIPDRTENMARRWLDVQFQDHKAGTQDKLVVDFNKRVREGHAMHDLVCASALLWHWFKQPLPVLLLPARSLDDDDLAILEQLVTLHCGGHVRWVTVAFARQIGVANGKRRRKIMALFNLRPGRETVEGRTQSVWEADADDQQLDRILEANNLPVNGMPEGGLAPDHAPDDTPLPATAPNQPDPPFDATDPVAAGAPGCYVARDKNHLPHKPDPIGKIVWGWQQTVASGRGQKAPSRKLITAFVPGVDRDAKMATLILDMDTHKYTVAQILHLWEEILGAKYGTPGFPATLVGRSAHGGLHIVIKGTTDDIALLEGDSKPRDDDFNLMDTDIRTVDTNGKPIGYVLCKGTLKDGKSYGTWDGHPVALYPHSFFVKLAHLQKNNDRLRAKRAEVQQMLAERYKDVPHDASEEQVLSHLRKDVDPAGNRNIDMFGQARYWFGAYPQYKDAIADVIRKRFLASGLSLPEIEHTLNMAWHYAETDPD